MRRRAWTAVLVLWALASPATAAAAGPGKVLGTVTPTAIAPEVEVCVVEPQPSETCASPGADGAYTLIGVPLGQVRIEFVPSHRSGYVPQYYRGVRRLSEATSILLTSQSREVGNIDATLERGGEIRGTVTGAPGGTPLAEVVVCATEVGQGSSAGCTETDSSGGYRLGALPGGSYKVGFRGHGASAEFAPRYYDEQSSAGDATPVTVGSGAVVTGVDAELVKGAQVTGTVTAAGGRLPGVPVCLFGTAAATPSECVFTDPLGDYLFEGIAPGSYQVGFSLSSAEIGGAAGSSEDDGYLTQYWQAAATRSEARTLTLAGAQVANGIDATLTMPAAPPLPVPPSPPSSNVIGAPPTITVPKSPRRPRCKKGYRRKKVKGSEKCVKPKPAKKAKKHPKGRRKKSTGHGSTARG